MVDWMAGQLDGWAIGWLGDYMAGRPDNWEAEGCCWAVE
jgi:hypothetical protein